MDESCPLFGNPSEFTDVLPTFQDVIKFCCLQRLNIMRLKNTMKEPAFNDIAIITAKVLKKMYDDLHIPTVTFERIIQMLKDYHSKYHLMKKNLKRVKIYPSAALKVAEFKERAQMNLFDISYCKCQNFEIDKCLCPSNKKVPAKRHLFLIDQRGTRQMTISSVLDNDMIEDEVEDISSFYEPSTSQNYVERSYELRSAFNKSVKEQNEPIIPESNITISSGQNRTKLTHTVLTRTRYDVTPRATAAIATAVLIDYNIITPEDTTEVIDKNKIIRETKRVLGEIVSTAENTSDITGLYFDGRRDFTLKNQKIGETFHKKKEKEDHYSLLKEPGSQYIGHITPTGGTAKEICDSILRFFSVENESALSQLKVVGADGTVLNTGYFCLLNPSIASFTITTLEN